MNNNNMIPKESNGEGVLTVSRLIEMLMTMPGEAAVVVEDAPTGRRNGREQERFFKALADVQATRETAVYDNSDQRTLTDARFCAQTQDARKVVCLRLK